MWWKKVLQKQLITVKAMRLVSTVCKTLLNKDKLLSVLESLTLKQGKWKDRSECTLKQEIITKKTIQPEQVAALFLSEMGGNDVDCPAYVYHPAFIIQSSSVCH